MVQLALAGGSSATRSLFQKRFIVAAAVLVLLLLLAALQLGPALLRGGGLGVGSAQALSSLRLGSAAATECDCSHCPDAGSGGSGAAEAAAAAAAAVVKEAVAQAATAAAAAAKHALATPEGEVGAETAVEQPPAATQESAAAASTAAAAVGAGAGADVSGQAANALLTGAMIPQLPQGYRADIVQRLWQYQPFLSPRSLRRGLYSMGEPARMRRFVHKLLSGQPISVSMLGGSVTAGQGAVHGGPYVLRFFNWLKQVSPASGQQADHTLRSPAFGGSTSGIFTVCVNDMVQEDADLVVVEFALNDEPRSTGQFRENRLRLGMERLFRKLLAFKNKPAVVMLNHYGWLACLHPGAKMGDYACSAENDFNVLGQYYGLPSLSIRAAAWHLMATNASGYQAHMKYSGHDKEANEADLYYWDEVHPQDRTGHWAMADLLVALVQQTVAGLAQRPLGPVDEEEAQEALPVPMTPGNYERRSSACLLQRAFEKVVVAQQGFEWKNERPAAELANQKWGWIATTPGSWAELEVDTTTAVQGDLKAESNDVIITYLKSYEQMGQAKVECIAGCTCETTQFDGYWEQKTSLTELHRFPVSQSKACRLRVTVLDGSSSPDGGKKIKLVGVMVIEGGWNIAGLAGIQLDLFANRAVEGSPAG